MKVLQGKAKTQPTRIDRQRRALLAKVHIAKKELAIPDYDYRYLLNWQFKKRSARDLTILELQYLVEYFKEHGWSAKKTADKQPGKIDNRQSKIENQAAALRDRIREVAGAMTNGERRLRGLCRKLCGVDRLEWCREPQRLKRLLAALERILAADEHR